MRQQDFSTVKWSRPHSKTHFIPKTHKHFQFTQKHNQIDQQVLNISVNNQKLQHQLAIYDWRCKTQFPIVKILHFKVLETKANSTVLQIKKEKCRLKLKNCKQLPLFKVLYLLKQSLIGFQRLYNKFGPFLVTPRMITINSSQKCKVWLNQNQASNSFVSIKINQYTFLLEIYRLFQQVSNNLKNTGMFYQQLHECKTFCEALALIQRFSQENKIIISSSCKLTSKEMVVEESQLDFTASLPINNKPDFLPFSGLRISLNTSSVSPYKNLRSPTTFIGQGTDKGYLSNLIKNKKTEDTAREGSHVNTSSNKEDLQRKYLDCHSNKLENKDIIYKSQLPVNVNSPQKYKFCVRKCNSHTTDIKQYEKLQIKVQLPLPSKKFDPHAKRITKPEPNTYGIINDEEDQQKTRHNIESAFEKNQWNKTLKGLLQEEGSLTHSIVNTQQKIKTNITPIQFQLLGKISKDIYQSFINGDSKAFYQSQPYTSEY